MISQIADFFFQAAQAVGYAKPAGLAISEPPAHIAGDYSCNLALPIAQEAGLNPREVAEKIKTALEHNSLISSVEIAGPGFLNITLSDEWYSQAMTGVGTITPGQTPQKISVEFISANPSGPLHIGNARGGPIGETLSRVLERIGHTVHRDFYVNDIGGQANKFAATVLHYYKQHFGQGSEFPEGGYPAPYVQELAKEIVAAEGERFLSLEPAAQLDAMRVIAIARQVDKIKATTERMGIQFNEWYPQSRLIDSGLSNATLDDLKAKDAVLEKDGALWLKSGIADDDRETVLVKSDGTTTYFLDDIAFYREKATDRGFSTGICVLGANHSGHIPRMRAAMTALGFPDFYQGTLYQYVQLKEDGETKRMAKREGNFVTADDVLDEIPRDVFTWFMLSKAPETHLDFDMKLAKDTSEKNPVYYVQYAHARICSVLEKAGEIPASQTATFNLEERALVRHMLQFNEVMHDIARSFRTHALPGYLYELATRYHHFYAHHRVITEDVSTSGLRLALSQKTAAILKEGLGLMNIEALARMDR